MLFKIVSIKKIKKINFLIKIGLKIRYLHIAKKLKK